MESEELRQVATEATRSAKARWKDIEAGKVEAKFEKTKIDLGSNVSCHPFCSIYLITLLVLFLLIWPP